MLKILQITGPYLLLMALPMSGGQAPEQQFAADWKDAVAFRMPSDAVAKERVTRASAWLERHALHVSRTQAERPLRVIAWKDPTLEPADPNVLAGYVITDTLWSAKALKLADPDVAQELEESIRRLGWYGNGLHDVLFHPLEKILHAPADLDFVHGALLGRFPTSEGRVVDLRVFRQKWDARFDVGHPQRFAEHAVYRALYDFWQGRHEPARRRLRGIIADQRAADPGDRILWDGDHGLLVDYVNYEEWLAFRKGERAACRHYTFKLGALLYAIRLMGMEHELGARLGPMKRRLWSAQTESGGLAHFVDVGRQTSAVAGREPTGEASAIAILSEVVEAKKGE
jgi:hypothetical protein